MATEAKRTNEDRVLAVLRNGPWPTDLRVSDMTTGQTQRAMIALQKSGAVLLYREAGRTMARLAEAEVAALWVMGAGDKRWTRVATSDPESAAHDACRAALASDREAVALIASPDGKVREYMITFNDDPDALPWWSHRTCKPLALATAKQRCWEIAPEEILGNFEPSTKGE